MTTEPEVNADCTKLVILRPDEVAWETTDQTGVSRKILERVNDGEFGRETSLVRLAPNTRLAPEVLETRLEVFVIEGMFSDGHGDYGARTFIMNPPGTTYTAASKEGCVIYVKRLNGFESDDERTTTDLNAAEWVPFGHRVAEVVPFYKNEERDVTARVGKVFPNATIMEHDHPGGEEVLILDGVFTDQFGDITPGSWARYPIGLAHAPHTADDGALVYIRDGDVRW
jgi:anti-sigma factor ChrR (cupin superfamily)